ncbi:MAG: asparagine synthase (glutamine-hydrolyzing) [Acidobacteria bacterium]|nr:asparagine synthase (glutamine-hydrolyzing) [Acidobacteriota bacterium]
MCGIAGIWEREGPPVEPRRIARFLRAVAHRGPDGEGIAMLDEGRLALGHRRLAILDTTDAGAQPMRSESGRYDITYNGEVYDFVELRRQLENDGFRFRSDSDTEVILAAYERWGADCLLRFNGMWSLAIWDRQERRLLLARDRFGVKPLYLAVDAHRVAFASELKAFRLLDGFDAAPDMDAVAARLALTFHERVLLRGVEMVPAGWCVEFTPEGSRRWRWWHTLDHLVTPPRDPDAQAEELRALLVDACRLRMRGDVPVATSLSGGLDSSSVVNALALAHAAGHTMREAPEWRHAFIAGFPGTAQDETDDARLAAAHAGAIPVERQFSDDVSREDIEAFLWQFEEIVGVFGLAPWMLYRDMRRQGVVVSIDGHGADELFGGYHLHVALALLRGRGALREPWRTRDLVDTWRRMHRPGLIDRQSNAALVAAATLPGALAVGRRLPVVRGRLREVLGHLEQHARGRDATLDADARAEADAIDALGPLTGALYRSFHHVSLPRILRAFDAHSMGHGVEVRMPFLDWRIVRLAFSLPDQRKVGGGFTKRVLRDAMRGVLPDRIRLRRDKLGYVAPVARWLDGGLGEWLWDEVNDPEFLRSGLWDGKAIHAIAAANRRSATPWRHEDARSALLAVAAHWWLTRWMPTGNR